MIFIFISLTAYCQAQNDTGKTVVIEKAKYLKEDINALLTKTTRYPKENIENKVQGDVIISFTINKEGQLDNLAVVNAAEPSLMASAISSFAEVTGNKWSPAKMDNTPVDKQYKVVFRFRQFVNEQPFDYNERASHLLNKEKYDKALKTCDSGIEENPYDDTLFEIRSQIKEKLGDMEGARIDHAIASTLKDEILTFVNLYVIGVTRTVTTTTRTSTPHLR